MLKEKQQVLPRQHLQRKRKYKKHKKTEQFARFKFIVKNNLFRDLDLKHFVPFFTSNEKSFCFRVIC